MKDNDYSIFDFVYRDDNDLVSLFNGKELLNYLALLDCYYLELRDNLGFDDSVTFGVELEFEHAKRKKIINELCNHGLFNEWELKDDSSLDCTKGAEVTSPILRDNSLDYNNLDIVCDIIKHNGKLGRNAGGHIHVGTQVLGDKLSSWKNFIKLWSVYENVIFRFCYGEYLTERPYINVFASPVASEFYHNYLKFNDYNCSIDEFIQRINHDMTQAVAFHNVKNYKKISFKNTLEFRCPNASLNSIIWQNNINFFVNLLAYCKSDKFDDDIVERRSKINKLNYSDILWYRDVFLEQALELADMIYDNNLDKAYFLRQYLKSFKTGKKTLVKANNFTVKR